MRNEDARQVQEHRTGEWTGGEQVQGALYHALEAVKVVARAYLAAGVLWLTLAVVLGAGGAA